MPSPRYAFTKGMPQPWPLAISHYTVVAPSDQVGQPRRKGLSVRQVDGVDGAAQRACAVFMRSPNTVNRLSGS